MFGFLYAPSPNCGSAAKSFYQSIFCGLSCKLHSDYHAAARFLVNRDSTFLALAGTALAENDISMQERTCCNPLANKRAICSHHDSLSYAAAVTVSGLATKLEDNAEDEQGWRKHLPRLASSIIGPARDEATAVLNSSNFPTQQVIQTLSQQTEIEQGKAGFMESSEPTAQAYGSIFSHLSKINRRSDTTKPLFLLGSSLGRLIYWKDALDDQKSDQRHGRFNPLNHQPAIELPPLIRYEFDQLQSSVTAIPWLRHRTLITSVIEHTVQHHQDSMILLKGKKKKKQKDSWWDGCCDALACCDCNCCSCDC